MYFVSLDALLIHLKNRLTTMSNQNFDTNSPIPSSSQPIPIAKQLEAQAYLSQVQNQRKDIANEEEDSSIAKLPERFSNYSAPVLVEETPQPGNKMDAFFRQAEEDERQRVLEAQNPTAQRPEQSIEESPVEDENPFDPAASLQPPELVQQDESPVVELPPVFMPTEAVNTQSEMAVPVQVEEAEFTPIPREPSPFSAESFAAGPFDENPISDVQSQFSAQQFEPVLDAPVEATSDVDDAPSSQQPPEFQLRFESPESPEPVESPEPSAIAESTAESEPRRLTGTAGLTAGLALAGMGALGALKASEPSSEVKDQEQSQPPATDDPLESIRQQLGNHQQQTSSYDATMMNPEEDGNFNVAPASNDASESNNSTPIDQTQTDDFGGDNGQSPWTQLDTSAENGQSEDISSRPQQIPPFVTGGFSGGFNPFRSSPADVNQVQHDSVDSAPENNSEPASSDLENTLPDGMPSSMQQVGADQDEPPQSSAAIQDEEDDVVDMRKAAERQAQRIKAERAKALVDGPAEPARPFGSNRQQPSSADHQQSVLEELGTPEAAEVQMDNEQQPPAQMVTVNPQHSRGPELKPLDTVGEDGNSQFRQFPMELFQHNLLRNLRSGVVFVDHKRRVQLWSKGAEAMTGIVSDAVIERPLYPQTFNLRFEDGTGVPLDKCPIVQCLETLENVTADYRTLNAENQEVKIEVAITPVIDEDRYLNGAILIFNDHSAEIDLQRQLKDLYEFSVLDPLTQVANRAEFERVLEEYVRAFNQSESFNCSIIICDIDFFKSINDNFGHAIGDQALVAFSEMLRTYVRSQDLVARYGGEEFVILCADCDTNSALQRAEQIRMGLFKTPQKMLDGKSISASFGVSELRPGDTAMEFFVRADTALLRAKEMGRNRVVIADQREANRNVDISDGGSVSGMQWRQQRREHTALICEEFKTSTPVPVLVEKLRGFIVEKDAWLQRVDQEFLSMEVDFEDPEDYSRKGSFTMNIEFKEGDEDEGGRSSKKTFIRVTIFPGRKKKWFSTNHTDVAPYLLGDLRSYLMINDEASHLSIKMATEDVRALAKAKSSAATTDR